MDITTLVELMKSDLARNGTYDRYPVRFFSIKYEGGISDTFIQLQRQLRNVEIYNLTDCLPHEEGWLSTIQLIKKIKELDVRKSFIIVGFSEYVRFLGTNDFVSLLLSLLEIEYSEGNPKRRLYFPCFALYSQIKKTIQSHHRRLREYNPLLNETDVEDLPRMFFLDSRLNMEDYSNEVTNSKEWFDMWKNPDIDTTKPILCTSKVLLNYYKQASPDNVYNIQQIENSQEMLKYMYLIDNLHAYEKDSERFYNQLITLVRNGNGKAIEDIILSEVNAQNVNSFNVYSLWKTNDMFKRWLIQNYVLMKAPKNSYLYRVMSCIEELSERELLEKVYECIFDLKDVALCKERGQILASARKIERDIIFSNRMTAYYNALLAGTIRRKTTVVLDAISFNEENEALVQKKDTLSEVLGEEIVPYLTCFSDYERQMIIWLYRMKFMKKDRIREIYPEFWYYLDDEESNAEPEEYRGKFEAYFKKYRDLRLAQENGETYKTSLLEWNRDENVFYKWYLDNQIDYPEVFLKKKGYRGTVYVLDGVGAEFMGYLLKILEDRGYSVTASCYGKCHLPSTTDVAQKFYPSEYKWMNDYDKQVIHGSIYYPVKNLENALSIIEALVDRIIDEEGDHDFAITADHGATVGHKIKKEDKEYDFDKSDHDGRCYLNKDRKGIDSSNDYLLYDDEFGWQWVIALNQRSLYKNSKYVVHGGATPEEVLVPVIVVHKGKQATRYYRVKPVNLKVAGRSRQIEVKINPVPKDEIVILKAKDGTNVEMVFHSDTNTWTGELKRAIGQDIEIVIDKQSFPFKTVPPTKMGDDLFDD